METSLQSFLSIPGIILDVRSPGEFTQGHIPGAYNLPLFNNQERAIIGTTYKQIGKEEAISLGLKIVGPKLFYLVEEVKKHGPKNTFKIHCWRGGMRSGFLAGLLRTIGFSTITLNGGYKTFRRSVLKTLSDLDSRENNNFNVIGGLTGSGKTEILKSLAIVGEQVLDLERLANHKGSSFGMIGMPPQPSNEQFENDIAYALSTFEMSRPIWIEDESRMIGTCVIPKPLYSKIQTGKTFLIEAPLEHRLERIFSEYGSADPHELIKAISRISKRLGGVRTKRALELFQTGNVKEAFSEILTYYDSAYRYSIDSLSRPIHQFKEEIHSPKEWSEILREVAS